jgi:hypothetical protein
LLLDLKFDIPLLMNFHLVISPLRFQCNGNKLLYTSDTETVNCCDMNGKSIWRFEDTSVLRSPRGVVVDYRTNKILRNFELYFIYSYLCIVHLRLMTRYWYKILFFPEPEYLLSCDIGHHNFSENDTPECMDDTFSLILIM